MYKFYFGEMRLPVTPQKMTLKTKGNNKTLTLINDGDINFLRKPGLSEISFDIVLPMLGRYSFSSDYKRPDYYLNAFEKLMTNCAPFFFKVIRVSPAGKILFDTNMKVSLEDYTITEDAADGLDVKVSVTLKQYIDYSTKIFSVTETESSGASVVKQEKERDSQSAPKAKTHTVKRGDCLFNIAKKYYGNGAEYMKIYNANKDKITNPNLIYEGQVLILP